MPVVQIIVTLIVLGVVLWLVNTYIPMAPPIKTVINVIIVLVLCLWLLSVFGLMSYTIPVRR
jgi:type IV secretory pathway TrbD component